MRLIPIFLLTSSLVAALGQVPKSVSGNADEFLRRGIAAQQSGDLKTAIEEYRKVLAVRPEMAEARANLGAALAAAGQFDAAIEEDRRALSNAPDKTPVRMNLALAYFKKGDFVHALPEFEAVHSTRPNDISAAMLLGYTHVKLGNGSAAVDLLSPFDHGHENDMDFQFVVASALILSGKDDDGLPRMERVAQATHSAEAYVIAGTSRMQRNEYQRARVDLDAALELDPSFPGIYSLVGTARDSMGDPTAARPAFEAALRNDPKDFNANLYLGSMRLSDRDFDGARVLLETALHLQPSSPVARFQMAKLNSMTGNYADAAKALEELESLDPNWLDPHVELATVYYKLHRPDEGQRERDIVAKIEAEQQKKGPKQ
jgi:tetratricopeptide (TPR) repeat protein